MENDELGNSELRNSTWKEREFSNHAGHMVTFKTNGGDHISGRICGVRDGGVLVLDARGNRLFCNLDLIALYYITSKAAAPVAKVKPKLERRLSKKRRSAENYDDSAA